MKAINTVYFQQLVKINLANELRVIHMLEEFKMNGQYLEIIKILEVIRRHINQPNTDITWSHYNSIAEVLSDLNSYTERLIQNDTAVLNDLRLAFGPTGSLQEISLSNGWGEEFLYLSSKFDDLIFNLR